MGRRAQNRIKSYTGTVHYADALGHIACRSIKTSPDFLAWSVATVTCQHCIAMFGADEPGFEDRPEIHHYADEHAARRAAERAVRRAIR